MAFIDREQFERVVELFPQSSYLDYLRMVLGEDL